MTAWRDKRTMIEAAANLRAAGLSLRRIARVLGYSPEHVRRLLKLSPFSA